MVTFDNFKLKDHDWLDGIVVNGEDEPIGFNVF